MNRSELKLQFLTSGNVKTEEELLNYCLENINLPENLDFMKNKDFIKLNIDDNLNSFYDIYFEDKKLCLKELKEKGSLLNLILTNFSSLIDLLNDNGYTLYYIDPKSIYYSDKGELIFKWDNFNKFILNDEKRIDKKVLNNYRELIDLRILKSGRVTVDELELSISCYTFYSLIYFLVTSKNERKFLRTKGELLEAFKSVNKKDIEYSSLYKIFNSSTLKNCSSVENSFKEFKKKIQGSPFLNPSNKKFTVNIGHDTIHGIHKKGIVNQDKYYYVRVSNNRLLFMVADGVSTADIGSGDLVSQRIYEYLFKNEESIKRKILDISGNNIEEELVKYLKELTFEINMKLESLVNEYIDSESNFDEDKYLMSSTIILGIFYENTVVTLHFGDSELFFIKNNEVMQLLVPHTKAVKELKTSFNDIKAERSNGFLDLEKIMGKKEIMRALPEGKFSSKKFVAEITENLEKNIFYVNEGDVIIIATDGLSDSIIDKRKNIETYLSDFFRKNINVNRKVIRKLLTSIDEEGGVDDITVIALSFRGDKNAG